MITVIADLFSPQDLAQARQLLEAAEWVDGKVTAGHQGARAKDNQQIPAGHPAAQRVGAAIVQALGRNPLFVAAALPKQILPPLFNRYTGGQRFGTHIDGSIRQVPGTQQPLRTDLSATFFFSAPEEYDGGELIIHDTYGAKSVKLPAGQMVLYPASSLHEVTPVTRGTRLCSFFWIQSLIRDDGERGVLFELDRAIQRVEGRLPGDPAAISLAGVYHNLLRRWAEV